MINTADLVYQLIAVDGSWTQRDFTNAVTDLGFEENQKELAARISFSLADEETGQGFSSALLEAGNLVSILAGAGEKKEEAARGFIVEWNPSYSSSGRKLTCQAYNELYNLQTSYEDYFFPAGTSTKQVITQIASEWGIPLAAQYSGPDVAHEKMIYKNKTIASVILELLDDAHKKGGPKSVLRCMEGYIHVLPYGSNPIVYALDGTMGLSINRSVSTKSLVTRVKVVGQSDEEGRRPVEAVVDGLTQYGIRQKIYSREKDASAEEAQKAAQAILDEEGTIKDEIKISHPEVPFIHKGDLVYLLNYECPEGYYYVESVTHDLDTGQMNLTVEKAPA